MYGLFSSFCLVILCSIAYVYCDSKSIDVIPEETLEYTLKGGTPTDIEKYPFLVSIQKFSIPRCVGSLISDSWILTAAHCLIDLNRKTIFILDPFEFIVISGRTVMTSGTMEGQERQAQIFIIHSRFERPSLKYDVGIVKTNKPFIRGPSTQPTKPYTMPPEVISFFPSCTLIGWNTGRHSFDDYEVPNLKPNSMRLEMIEVKVMSSVQCQAILYRLVSVDSICTYLDDQCPGQSGSPLICGQSLYGVFTWTAGCTNSSFPAVFVRVAKINLWIQNMMNGQYIESFRRVGSYGSKLECILTLMCFLNFFKYFIDFRISL